MRHSICVVSLAPATTSERRKVLAPKRIDLPFVTNRRPAARAALNFPHDLTS